MKSYSTIDHIHIVSKGIEKSAQRNRRLSIEFISYEDAFDPVYNTEVLEA